MSLAWGVRELYLIKFENRREEKPHSPAKMHLFFYPLRYCDIVETVRMTMDNGIAVSEIVSEESKALANEAKTAANAAFKGVLCSSE